MSSTIKHLMIQICYHIIDWVALPITHVALPALLLFLHVSCFKMWEIALPIPTTIWSVVLFGLIVWFSGGVVHYLDHYHYFKSGAIAEFFGFDEDSQD